LILWLKVDLYAQIVLSPTEDVCAGELKQYKVEGSAGSTIYWLVEGGVVYKDGSPVIDQDLATPGFHYSELITSGESLIGILWDVTAGDYLVRAYEETTGSCVSANMVLTVTVSALPDQSLALNNPSICPGGTASIILTNSESGISYQLRLDSDNSNVGSTVAGTGGNITFNVNPVETTVYNVYAENLVSTCGVELDDKCTVTVEDLVDPVAVCKNITIQLDAMGDASILASDIDNGSSDNCATPNLSASQTSFDCTDVGANNVTLTVTDGAGNSASCVAVVTVEDNIDPTASDPAGISVQCVGDIPVADITVVTDEDDNCTVNPTVAFVSDISDGNTCPELVDRTYSVTDESGNSINVTQTITINDTQDPTVLCQDVTVSMDAGGNASINAAQIDNGSYDACGIASISISPSTFDSGDMSSTTIASSDGYDVYIKAYATSVTPVGNSCEWGYNYSVSIAYEISFSGVNIPANLYSLSGSVSCGDMYFNLPNTGGSGSVNTSNSWTSNTDCATVTPKSLGCNSIEISISGPGIVSQTVTLANTANTVLTVTDNCGNTSTCNATVTLEDNTDPTASNPAAIIVQCTAPDPDITVVTDEADNCTANPTVAFVSDVSDGNTSPELIVRTYSVTDESGNSINVTQTITINDTTDPVIPTLSDVKGECSATATVPSTTDNCAGTITGTTTDPLTYTTQGTHVITWTFDDGRGNSKVVTQNVIINDITNPTITAPADMSVNTDTGSCSASSVVLETPITDDNCGVALVSNDAPATYPLGNTTVTWKVTDNSGRIATTTQVVTVTDNTPPEIPSLSADYYESADYYGGEDFQTFRETLIVDTVNYNWGLGVSESTLVGVDDFSVRFQGSVRAVQAGTYTFYTTSDDCVRLWVDGQLIIDNWAMHASVVDIGTVDLTAGQVASIVLEYREHSGYAIIKLEWEGPGIPRQFMTAIQEVVIDLSAVGSYDLTVDEVDPGYTDACGIDTRILSKTNFTCSDIGVNQVTLTVTDVNGNSSSCVINVIVRDVTSPVLADLSDLSIVDCAEDESVIPQVKSFSGLGIQATRYTDNCTTSFVVEYQIQLPDSSFANAYGVQATGANSAADPSGFNFPEGVSIIHFRVLDASGNISNVKTYTVTVNHKPIPSGINY